MVQVFPEGSVTRMASSSKTHAFFFRSSFLPFFSASSGAFSSASSNTSGASMPNLGTNTTTPFALTRTTRASHRSTGFFRKKMCV